MTNLLIFFLFPLSFRSAESSTIQPIPIRADTCRTGQDRLTGKKIYLDADTGPECEGGTVAWFRHLNKTLKVTKMPSGEVQSTYIIAFVVDKDGTISGERVVNGPKNAITNQLFAAVRTIRWIPGRCHGKNVAMLRMLPITIEYAIE
jgi:hypothetical protein